jgi:hypothetical protein
MLAEPQALIDESVARLIAMRHKPQSASCLNGFPPRKTRERLGPQPWSRGDRARYMTQNGKFTMGIEMGAGVASSYKSSRLVADCTPSIAIKLAHFENLQFNFLSSLLFEGL